MLNYFLNIKKINNIFLFTLYMNPLISAIKLLPGNKKSGLEFIIRQLQVVLAFAFFYWLAGHFHKRYPDYDPIIKPKIGEIESEKERKEMEKDYTPWSFGESFYFSLVTQTTVGYGDMVSHTRISRIINILQLLTIYGVLAFSWV